MSEFDTIIKDIDKEIRNLKEYYTKKMSQFNTVQTKITVSLTPNSSSAVKQFKATYPANRVALLSIALDTNTSAVGNDGAHWVAYSQLDVDTNTYTITVGLYEVVAGMYGTTYSVPLVITSTGSLTITEV